MVPYDVSLVWPLRLDIEDFCFFKKLCKFLSVGVLSLNCTWKMGVQSILNINSLHAHMKLKLGMFGVAIKLVNKTLYLCKSGKQLN
jgi:hypothetical protein